MWVGKRPSLLSADKITCPAPDFVVSFPGSGYKFVSVFEEWRGWVSGEIGCKLYIPALTGQDTAGKGHIRSP